MNKNILRIVVFACVPFNLAMSMDLPAEEQGCKRERSNTIIVLPKKQDSEFKRARSPTIVESDEPQLKFKGFYPAPSDSDDIYSRIPLSKFFMLFDPGKDPKKTAAALRVCGVRTNSSFETIQQRYNGYLKELIINEGEDPANYVAEIIATCSHFKNIYPNIIKPYIRIIKDEERALFEKVR
jgi:hypothetical protein